MRWPKKLKPQKENHIKEYMLKELYDEYDHTAKKLISLYDHYLAIHNPRLTTKNFVIRRDKIKEYRELIDNHTYSIKHNLEYIIDRINFIKENFNEDEAE